MSSGPQATTAATEATTRELLSSIQASDSPLAVAPMTVDVALHMGSLRRTQVRDPFNSRCSQPMTTQRRESAERGMAESNELLDLIGSDAGYFDVSIQTRDVGDGESWW